MSIGIIVATDEELIEIKNVMDSYEEKDIYELNFVKGKINGKKVIVVKCGVGKVNAARTTQILIDNFKISKIINIGAAGGINPELKIQDIVIGEKIVQYDFDTTSAGDYEKGEIQGIGKFIRSDYELINICKKVLEKRVDNSINVVIGTIATADIFCSDPEIAKEVREEFGAECVEMEGAAIAQVCFLDKIPFLVIRGISDTPNGHNEMDYYTYCHIAAKHAAEFLQDLLWEDID